MGKHQFDLSSAAKIHKNLDVETLIQHCLERDNCKQLASGAVVAFSGEYTGRTPKDKFTVADAACEGNIWWENNNRMEPEQFDSIFAKMQHYAADRELYIIDTFGGADPAHRIKTRFIVERPKDEFTDNGGWPWMIYIREARRMVGVTRNDRRSSFMSKHSRAGRCFGPTGLFPQLSLSLPRAA